MTGQHVRRMRWWDIEAVAALDTELFGPDTWTAEFFWSQLATPGAVFTVAEAAGASASVLHGYVGLGVSGPQSDILTIGVSPQAQGQGLGRVLLEHAAQQAHDLGAEVLHLDVAADNTAALGLYASFGFQEIGRRPGYYAHADAVVMRTFL